MARRTKALSSFCRIQYRHLKVGLRRTKNRVPWTKAGVVVVTLGAFCAFAIGLRQKEYLRFGEVKPIFEIRSSVASNTFTLRNHGGVAYFIGCSHDIAWERTPWQYAALTTWQGDDEDGSLQFKLANPENVALVPAYVYWRDSDLNLYRMKIGLLRSKGSKFYIDGVPLVRQADEAYTIPYRRLDAVFDGLFPKRWYHDFPKPDDSTLQVTATGTYAGKEVPTTTGDGASGP